MRSFLTNDRVADDTPVSTDVTATGVVVLRGRTRVVVVVTVLKRRESVA